MFDLSFAEILVIAVIALVVLGPERLPRAARFTGLWVRRARGQWQSVRSEFERELAAEELKRNLDQARSAMRDADRDMRGAEAAVRREAQELRDGLTPGTTTHVAAPPDAGTASTAPDVASPTVATAVDSASGTVAEPSTHPSEATGSDGQRR
ncbi:Sec-independent protein translocase protein TatB [Luteimonas sp. MHLX1A]|uniref:Sec-independent protein translocase protein TatB n=1 Tax=Alterluteimonas muca TaxID=2878684 RepID=UPI001E3E40F6|nr:Sec-independent protein translocase protein TatB [Luteimonas sp. MHLX1A]MCD9048068.1 Sec-independent protein translocase protein TatB [Luteimonas sp. MHLX1A]